MKLIGGKYTLRPAIADDAYTVLHHIRKEDVQEWDYSMDGGVMGNLYDAIRLSKDVYTIAANPSNMAHMIFGVQPEGGPGAGVAWLLGTDHAADDAFVLAHQLRAFQTDYLSRWEELTAYSYIANKVHHRWLEWLGFRHLHNEQRGPYNSWFLVYHYKRGQ